MAFESKSVFKLTKVYQRSSMGISFQVKLRTQKFKGLKAHNKKLFSTSTQRFFTKESYQRTANCLD